MHYISAAEIYSINEAVLGREPSVRDRRLLQAAVVRPFQQAFGQEAYPSIPEKAAALLHALAHDHPFADGYKRTAREAVTRFLEGNGYRATWDDEEAYAFILRIARGDARLPEITDWMNAHTTPCDDNKISD